MATSSMCSQTSALPQRCEGVCGKTCGLTDLAPTRRTTMNTGTILAVLSLATAAGNIATYYPKMKSNQATLRPRREQTLMALALLLALAAFFLQPGVAGCLVGALAIIPASLFLLGTFTSGLPHQQPAVAGDELAPDFSGFDAEG